MRAVGTGQGKDPLKRSAGIVPVRFIGAVPHYLLLRVFRYWDFPKGEIGPGEDPLTAAIRELEEETTLTDVRFAWGQDYRETPPYRGGKIARYYLAETPEGEVQLPVNPVMGMPEHHEFRWATAQAARELLNDRVRAILDWAEEQVGRG